ncbi:ArsR/SmtB family transcription factor [Acaryochloris marina NIES-2412]|uniref:ArsR/SmtB family transcription factor n=1 Tax=Acaryochloris marina TaxID=155978 RepID=UPI00405A0A36
MPKTFSAQTSSAVLEPVAEYFKMLSEVSRLQILSCLRSGPMNGKDIIEATGIGQANLSKHLKALTQTGILSRRPEGVTVYYEISDPIIFELCELVCDRITNQLQQRAEEFEQFKDFIKVSK